MKLTTKLLKSLIFEAKAEQKRKKAVFKSDLSAYELEDIYATLAGGFAGIMIALLLAYIYLLYKIFRYYIIRKVLNDCKILTHQFN